MLSQTECVLIPNAFGIDKSGMLAPAPFEGMSTNLQYKPCKTSKLSTVDLVADIGPSAGTQPRRSRGHQHLNLVL